MKKWRLTSLLGWLFLFLLLAVISLTGCGSWRPSSMNYKDDLMNMRLTSQVINANIRDSITTSNTALESEMNHKIAEAYLNDAIGGQTNEKGLKKVLGLITTPFSRKNNKIVYTLTKPGMKPINWELVGSEATIGEIYPGTYKISIAICEGKVHWTYYKPYFMTISPLTQYKVAGYEETFCFRLHGAKTETMKKITI